MTYTIGIIGGTGREGRGLGYRWAQAGHKVIIGSRSEEKALAAVDELNERLHGEGEVSGTTNDKAVLACDIAVLTVPFSAHRETLEGLKEELQGKILIDVAVPLVPPKVTRVQMPEEGSAAQQAQAILGDDVKVVAAFQTISFERLLSNEEIECDVLVAGGDKACLLYTSDAADDLLCVDLGGRRIIKKKTHILPLTNTSYTQTHTIVTNVTSITQHYTPTTTPLLH